MSSSAAARCLAPPLFEGADGPGVLTARALLDAIARGEPLPPGDAAVILCAGRAALPCARALSTRGLAVTLVCGAAGHAPGPCEAARAAATAGIAVEAAARPSEVIRRGGRARWLRLTRGGPDDGFVLPADLVILDAG